MLDLTQRKQEKENYILSIQPCENIENYKVIYANGEETIFPFTIHNLQIDLCRMEQQYFTYASEFYEQISNADIVFFSKFIT